MGVLRTTVTIDFRSFTGPEAADRFTRSQLSGALRDISRGDVSGWAFHNLELVGTEYVPSPGEVIRYEVIGYGACNDFYVRDNDPGPVAGGSDSMYVAGPFANKFTAEKVRKTLQQLHEGEITDDEPDEEDRGGDSGDSHDIPF